MKHRTRKTIAASLVAASLAHAAPLPPMAQLLDAMSYAESRNNDNAVGRDGERGRWQFTKATWLDVNAWRYVHGYARYRFESAKYYHSAVVVAEDYATWLCIRFQNEHGGRTPSLLEFCARWRKPANGRVTPITRQLYSRVVKRLRQIQAEE